MASDGRAATLCGWRQRFALIENQVAMYLLTPGLSRALQGPVHAEEGAGVRYGGGQIEPERG
ncbi:hypothetical protein B7992_04070 [Fibrobacter sp. UWH1]|nr:hypothetical protein B7992_04070 [Fibrobacter sp. UWH1]